MKLWLLWVLACAVGFSLGGRFGRALGPSDDLIVVGYAALSSGLLVSGLLQWLILRPTAGTSSAWVLASVVGVATMGLVVWALGLVDRDVGWVVGVIVGWVALGVFQWWVLRGDVAGAGWWVAAHAVALLLAGPGVGFATWLTGAEVDSAPGNLVRWLSFGSVYGVVTGSALWWLLRERLSLATGGHS